MVHFEDTKKMLNNSTLFYIITTNMEGNYSYINEHYASEFSHISNNFVGEPYHITMHLDDMKTCEEVSAKCFENSDVMFPATIRKIDGKGGYIYTQWEYRAMYDDENNKVGIFCLGYNITKYISEELELLNANKEILKKDGIIDTITFQQSHLIRSPLSNIIGLVSIIDKTLLDVNNSNICDMILESSNQLDEVVKSIVSNARK
ncbi:MAG: hypothetical protein ABI554_03655 [Flavobacterium sp.]